MPVNKNPFAEAPNPGHILGEAHGEAVAAHREAGRLTDESVFDAPLQMTPHNRAVIEKARRGEELTATEVVVNPRVIAEARRRIDRFKPKQ